MAGRRDGTDEEKRRPREWEAERRDPRGYGGEGGGRYSGGAGGLGPGEADEYPQASGPAGGLSGAGSLLGEAGSVAGWRPERMGLREGGAADPELEDVEPSWERERGRRRGWAREGPLVRDLMTRHPKTVLPTTTVIEVARVMRDEETGIVPVVEDGRVVGVVTDRDLVMRVLAEGQAPESIRVSSVMSDDLETCGPDDKLHDAIRVMGLRHVRRLPVVDRGGRLVGVISMTDVAREAEMDYALQESLEQLTRRRSFWTRW